MAYRLLIIHHS